MENLTNEIAVIGEVTFKFHKAPAMKAWAIMEDIRRAMATTDVKDGGHPAVTGIKALMGLPTEFVNSLRVRMFEYVDFQTLKSDGGLQPAMKLKGMEDMAFASLEPVHVYEVLARALAVNFTESWKGILSTFPFLEGQNTVPSGVKTSPNT